VVNLSVDISTNLTEGFQPFNLVPMGFSAQADSSAAASTDYDQLTARGHTTQYSDILAIQGWQSLVLPSSTSGVGVHIRTSYIALATILGPLHPFTMAMRTLLDNWIGAEMELPGLLALIPNGPAACVFWMALQFHYYFHDAKTQPNQGPPPMLHMTELTKQLRLHIFSQLAPVLPTRYLPAMHQPLPLTSPFTPRILEGTGGGCNAMRVVNPIPNPAFHTFNKAGWLGTGVLKQPVPTMANGQTMCLSYHLCNACNSDCPRAADHKVHMPAEDNLLLAWAKNALSPLA